MTDKMKGEFIVKHEGGAYDIKHFLRYHPGGTNTLAPFKNLDISNKLHDHSTAAMYLMKDYKLDETKKPTTEPEDLEKLVDWSKALLPQVGRLGAKYQEWVTSPVDREIRLFESDLMEAMSITPWYAVPAFWVPIGAAFAYHGYYYQNPNGISTATLSAALLAGYALWFLLEYSLHRWLFHATPSPDSPAQITAHFLIHGIHHKVPFCPGRLVMPPVAMVVATSLVYLLLWLALPTWLPSLVGTGTLVGYVTYDLTHYYLHHGSPAPGTHMYHMKRYHNRHHYTQHDTGFGISGTYWDRFFGTEIVVPKLVQTLKWW